MADLTIITGASRGIGRAVAERFAADGHAVCLVAKNISKLKAAEESIKARRPGADVWTHVGDVTDPYTARLVADMAREGGWTPANLILSAGVSRSGPFQETDWKDLFGVNFGGVWSFLREFLPGMAERKAGTVCILAGSAGVKPYRNMAAYCASKHALVGLAKSVALEVGRSGVLVVPVCPGPVDTDMTAAVVDGLVSKGLGRDKARAKIGEDNANKKSLLRPEEVAEDIARICSRAVDVKNGEPFLIG